MTKWLLKLKTDCACHVQLFQEASGVADLYQMEWTTCLLKRLYLRRGVFEGHLTGKLHFYLSGEAPQRVPMLHIPHNRVATVQLLFWSHGEMAAKTDVHVTDAQL